MFPALRGGKTDIYTENAIINGESAAVEGSTEFCGVQASEDSQSLNPTNMPESPVSVSSLFGFPSDSNV